ncbi:MAG: lysophospholipid acyltransferase family protein [Caldimonas sp.]
MRVSTVLAGVAQRGLLFLLLVQLGAMSLAWSIVAWLLYPILPKPRATVLGRTAIAWMYRTFWATAGACGMLKIDAAALDRLRDEPGGLIIAANHPTMLDALVVVARLPRGVCIMKAELMRNPFLGAGARLARYIRNDSSRGMVRCAVECLREGGQLVMFPEGTRTVEQPLNPFRPGISLIAQLAQVPIQTVIIDTETAYLRKGWPIWRAPPVFPVRIRARLGARFAADADHRALVRKLECYFVRELAGAEAGTETEREAA